MLRFQRPALALVFWLSAISALAACAPLVPATVPPHIKHTPGASVVVTDKRFDAGIFRLEYPRAWSVVKTSMAAADHIHVYFLAPDGGYVSLQQVEAVESSAADEHLNLPNGVILKVSIERAEALSTNFAAEVRRLIESIRS